MDTKIVIILLVTLASTLVVSLILGIIYKKENIIAYKKTLIVVILNSVLLVGVYFIENEFLNLACLNTIPVMSLLLFRHMHKESINQFEGFRVSPIKDIVISSVPYIVMFLMTLSTIQTFVNRKEEIAVIEAFNNSILYAVVIYQLIVMRDTFMLNVKNKRKALKKYQQVFILNMGGIIFYASVLIYNTFANTLDENKFQAGIIYCVIVLFLMINHTYKDYFEKEPLKHHDELIKKVNKSINDKGSIDPLTGVFKREFFNKNINSFDSDDVNISVVIMKMTGLKLINESFGYEKGDDILQETALILSEIFSDSVIARVAGSQFVITQSGLTEDELSNKIKIIEDICTNRDGFIINVCVGVSEKRLINRSLQEMYIRAEENLYNKQMLNNRKNQIKLSNALWNNFGKLLPDISLHLDRCANLAESFGKYMDMSTSDLVDLRNAALLHDIALTIKPKTEKYKVVFDNEFENLSYKNHPSKGYDIVLESGINSNVAKAILCHHERIDGKGYPHGLKEAEIPDIAQIVSLIDFVDMILLSNSGEVSLENELLSTIAIEFSEDIVYNMIGFLKKTMIIKEN